MRSTARLTLGTLVVFGLVAGCRTTSGSQTLDASTPAQAKKERHKGPRVDDPDDGDEGSNYWEVAVPADAGQLEGAGSSEVPPSIEQTNALVAGFPNTVVLQDNAGQTYLSFMKTVVKPAMDDLATGGYPVAPSSSVDVAYQGSASKIRKRVDSTWGGLDAVKGVVDQLAGQTVNLNNLPSRIGSLSSDRYNLATFVGLASGGGVNVQYTPRNYGLNVHYDKTNQQSGRSFGVGPTRGANDASDADYLKGLEAYVVNNGADLPDFYAAMFDALLNSDTGRYLRVEPEGQTILSDFLAVFTAEQARNLMDGTVTPHWDAALMEVTLLAAFHGGQDKIKLYYNNPATGQTKFVARTLKQRACAVPTVSQKATLVDYWQFSKNINSQSACRRSGINITKKEFRRLGKDITKYMKQNHPAEFKRVAAAVGSDDGESNLFEALSVFLISEDSPDSLDRTEVQEISEAWVALLGLMNAEANEITASIGG